MTRIARVALTLVLAAVVGGLVGCGDNKVAVPTKLDQPLPTLASSGGGGKKADKKPDAPGPNQKAD